MLRRFGVTAGVLFTLVALTQLSVLAQVGAPYGGYLPLVYRENTPVPTATLQPTAAPPPAAIGNGSFEAGKAGWIEASQNGFDVITDRVLGNGFRPHSGSWYAWLGGSNSEIATITQRVSVPRTNPSLTYWRWIASQDPDCDTEADIGGILLEFEDETTQVIDAFFLCSSQNTNGWRSRTINLQPYAGRVVNMYFLASTDTVVNSNLFIDDVSFGGNALATTNTTKADVAAKPLAAVRKTASRLSPANKQVLEESLLKELRAKLKE